MARDPRESERERHCLVDQRSYHGSGRGLPRIELADQLQSDRSLFHGRLRQHLARDLGGMALYRGIARFDLGRKAGDDALGRCNSIVRLVLDRDPKIDSRHSAVQVG